MKKTVLFLLILCTHLILLLGQTEITGHLSGDSYNWDTLGSPYIITDSLVIDQDAYLNIGPGVIVMFKYKHNSLRKSALIVNGNLNVAGTNTDPVIFTSERDDSYGDFTGDSSATIPRPGDWGFIEFNFKVSLIKYSD